VIGRSSGSTLDDNSGALFVNIQHRGGDDQCKAIAVTELDSTLTTPKPEPKRRH
jgi:hypothetical protein